MRRVSTGLVVAAIAALFVLAALRPALAEERITGFRSDIEVRQDGSMRVAETISVIAEGVQIRHGIYRDIPTLYRSPTGENYRVGFNVVSVERDGAAEPYITQGISNGKRVRIGSADTFVPQGEHSYRITYDVTGEIGFFKDYDELYWNVNGTGWDFTADRVEAQVSLPAGARILDYTAYTGEQGSTAKDFRADLIDDAHIHFETTHPLGAHENLTIVVSWPKGIVAEPTKAQRAERFLAQNLPIFASGLGFLLVLGYYMSTWLRVGKDPPAGTIVPLFHPPKDLSPAAVRFIRRMGYDRKAFTAALIDMAVKGYLRIEDDGSKFELVKTGSPQNLSSGEKRIGDALFSGARSIKMTNAHHAKFGSAINRLRESLEAEHQKTMFARNQIYFWIGIAITLGIAAITALLSPNPEETIGGGLMISFWVGVGAFAFTRLWQPARGFHDLAGGVTALVALQEGINVTAQLTDVNPEDVAVAQHAVAVHQQELDAGGAFEQVGRVDDGVAHEFF